jgi:hypothetical protein
LLQTPKPRDGISVLCRHKAPPSFHARADFQPFYADIGFDRDRHSFEGSGSTCSETALTIGRGFPASSLIHLNERSKAWVECRDPRQHLLH